MGGGESQRFSRRMAPWGGVAVALALVAVARALDSTQKPMMRDAVNFDAHLNTMYAKKIDGYSRDLDLVKDKTSKQAMRLQMIVHELELSRAEACRKVLKMHHVDNKWVTDPTVDESIGNMQKGYDTPMVPLRKLLSTPKPEADGKPAPQSTQGQQGQAATAKPAAPTVLHIAPLNDKEEETPVDLADLGEMDHSSAQTLSMTSEQAGMQEAEEVIAEIKSQAAAATSNTSNSTEVKYSVVEAKVQSIGQSLVRLLATEKIVCASGTEDHGPDSQACLKLKTQVETLKGDSKEANDELKGVSKVKEECNDFVTEMKARRSTKSRRRAWGTGVNASTTSAPPLDTLDPALQKWFRNSSEIKTSTISSSDENAYESSNQ